MSQASVPQEDLTKPVSKGNRRVCVRYRCAPATIGKVISAEDQEFQQACILDLSLKGIGMELARPVAAGHLVIITIRSTTGTKLHELAATVKHCVAAPQGSWYVGCELSVPLTPDELEQLL